MLRIDFQRMYEKSGLTALLEIMPHNLGVKMFADANISTCGATFS